MEKIKTPAPATTGTEMIFTPPVNGVQLAINGNIVSPERKKAAKALQQQFQSKIGDKGIVTVDPDPGVGRELLEPVKQLLKDLGIKLSELENMRFDKPRTIG